MDAFQAKKILLENKVNLIERLRAEQKSPVHMLDEISKALPDFVWLTSMDETAGKRRLQGAEQRPDRGGRLHQRPAAERLVPDRRPRGEHGSRPNIVNFDLSSQFKNPEIAAQSRRPQAAAAAAQRRPRRPPRGAGSREEERWPTTASPGSR